MADEVHDHIEQLVAEEHRLWEQEAQGQGGDEERDRLAQIKVELDRYWDLLRRRNAAAAAGGNADDVELRGEDVVENYLQ